MSLALASRRSLFGLGAAIVAAPALAKASPAPVDARDDIDRLPDAVKRVIAALACEMIDKVHVDHPDAAGLAPAAALRLVKIDPPPSLAPFPATLHAALYGDAPLKAYVDGTVGIAAGKVLTFNGSTGCWTPSSGIGVDPDHYRITDYGRTVSVVRRWSA